MSWPIPLETLKFSPFYIQTLNILAYTFRDSKCFALIILRLYVFWPIILRTLSFSPY